MKKGAYYIDCKEGPVKSKQCNDPEAAKALWEQSEKLWGVKFDLWDKLKIVLSF